VVPALAVADVLRADGHDVGFCGAGGIEKRLVPREGYDYRSVRVRGFQRRLGWTTLKTLASLPLAAVDAWRILGDTRPDCVIGVGAYASGPVVAEAAVRGIPSAIVEMDAHLGWTNRILSRLVDRVFLSFPVEGREGHKFVYTGRPLRPGLMSATREEGLLRFGLDGTKPVVLVFGGSLGSSKINRAAVSAFGRGLQGFSVIHVAGERDFIQTQEQLAGMGGNPDYRLFSYLDDFPLALAVAHVAVSRAGGSVAELLALGIPSILVPFPAATADHQSKNAHAVEEAGAARMIADSNLTVDRLAREVQEISQPEVRDRMALAARALARTDAATRIAKQVVELIGARGGA